MANKKKPSSSKYQKKAVKTVAKAAKKNPKGFLIALLVIAVVVGIGLAVYFLFLKDKIGPSGTSSSSQQTTSEVISSSSHSHSSSIAPVDYDPKITTPSGMSINFLELGNKYTGDSTYIKAGDVDILIDAGSRQSSAGPIKEFINKYCEDGKLEYVIATHAHQDHISGFVGTTKIPGIFESYKIGTLIDFAYTNTDSEIYANYVTKREAGIASGNIEHHYTAEQCVNLSDGAQKEYVINDYVKMTILDQKFYHPQKTEKEQKAVNENDFSVCALFTHNNQNHYLFTGDLEEAGEKSLAEMNNLPHCQLFKGGHHGSYTANNDCLLNEITPETVCICTCCGTVEYDKTRSNPGHRFPAQEAIDRIAKHTERIYCTTLIVDYDKGDFTSMNGNICFKSENGKEYTVAGSNNSVILKDTEWFKTNRTWPTE